MAAYYNECDPVAAEWLRAAIAQGDIASGEVDDRPIQEVRPSDLQGFTQCHFFAGIGIWSYALREAGWKDSRPVWTGSCPCQPFSLAGARKKDKDARHLWPVWHDLIAECRPIVVFGEQVAQKAGIVWLDSVSDNLEDCDYVVGAVCTSAAGFGAPHLRHRTYFVGHRGEERQLQAAGGNRGTAGQSGTAGTMANANGAGLQGRISRRNGADKRTVGAHGVVSSILADTASARLERAARALLRGESERRGEKQNDRRSSRSRELDRLPRIWKRRRWIPCRDAKKRPIEPSTFPLADGDPTFMGRLRGYGNSLCAPQAQAFIEAYLGEIHASRQY